jgi:hypothetical protein
MQVNGILSLICRKFAQPSLNGGEKQIGNMRKNGKQATDLVSQKLIPQLVLLGIEEPAGMFSTSLCQH